VELFRYLNDLEDRKYSYRLILGPEYFAAAGFLESASDDDIALMKGGIYFDMMGNNQPFCFQRSFQGTSILDKVIKNIFHNHVPHYKRAHFKEIFGNDEIFYNGPGFMIPCCAIVCDRHPEYHFDTDNLELVNLNQLEFALGTVKKIITALEEDFAPVPRFKGPIYLNRYNLYIDPKIDRKGYDNIQNIQILMDSKRSCLDIAHDLGIDFFFVKSFCKQLLKLGLVDDLYVNHFVDRPLD
jgi:aminopeptidase-like protein